MDQLEKTSEMTVQEIPYNSSNKEPLLKKYNIPVQHLDFAYVEKCTDAKELERILQILKSGQEGYYPQLLARTEEQLAKIKPNSRHIRKLTRVLSKKEIDEEYSKEITQDLNNWLSDMDKKNSELSQVKHAKKLNLPEVRQSKEAKDEKDKENVPKRIKSTDYAAWDKYDVDTELLKMDLEEEKLKKEAEKLANEKHKKRTVKFNEFTTTAEASFEAQHENIIANEYFKAGEYENAVEHYTNSIAYFPSATSFANRATTFLSMKKYEDAISDYVKALKYEPNNPEYILQLGKCYSMLRKWSEALACAETAIKLDPNNKGAQKLAENAKKSGGKLETNKVRLSITDVNTKSAKTPKKSILKKEEKTEIIPIPGTSKTCGPFYKVVHSEDPNIIRKEKEMINNCPKRVFMTNVEISSDDDDFEHVKTPNKNNSPWIKKDMCAGDSNNNVSNSKVSKNVQNKSKKKVCQKISKKITESITSTLLNADSNVRNAKEKNEIDVKTLYDATTSNNQTTAKEKEEQSPNNKSNNTECKNDKNKGNENVTDELNNVSHSWITDSIHQQERTSRNLRQTVSY